MVNFYFKILKLFSKNDLSLFKRISKYVFKAGELSLVRIEEVKEDKIASLSKALKKILNLEIKSKEDSLLLFSILNNIGKNNADLLVTLLKNNSSDFFNYCYTEGFLHKKTHNKDVLQATK